MSYQAMEAVFKRSKAKAGNRLVMLVLAHHADATGYCYPGVDTIAGEAGLSMRQIRRNLRNLEEVGEIVTKKRENARGRCYQLMIMEDRMSPSKEDKMSPRERTPSTVNADLMNTEGGHCQPSKGDAHVPRTEIELKENENRTALRNPALDKRALGRAEERSASPDEIRNIMARVHAALSGNGAR